LSPAFGLGFAHPRRAHKCLLVAGGTPVLNSAASNAGRGRVSARIRGPRGGPGSPRYGPATGRP